MGGMVCFGLFVMVCQPQNQDAPPPVSTYCQIAKPIRWSGADTRKTKEDIDTENRKYKRLCSSPKKQG